MDLTVNGENLPGKPLQLKVGADSNYNFCFSNPVRRRRQDF